MMLRSPDNNRSWYRHVVRCPSSRHWCIGRASNSAAHSMLSMTACISSRTCAELFSEMTRRGGVRGTATSRPSPSVAVLITVGGL